MALLEWHSGTLLPSSSRPTGDPRVAVSEGDGLLGVRVAAVLGVDPRRSLTSPLQELLHGVADHEGLLQHAHVMLLFLLLLVVTIVVVCCGKQQVTVTGAARTTRSRGP